MSDPDSIVQYVTWLDGRHNRLVDAVLRHRNDKRELSVPGSIDAFDHLLWSTVDGIYEETPEDERG